LLEVSSVVSIEDKALYESQKSPRIVLAAEDDTFAHNLRYLVGKASRHKLFAQWLVQTYGAEFLSTGSGVLDVAGGQGELGDALRDLGVPSVLLEPSLRSKHRAALQCASQEKAVSANAHDVQNVLLPTVGTLPGGWPFIAIPLHGDGEALLGVSGEVFDLVSACSMVIGMHPDQATEAIVDISLRLGVPFAVLPCCVMQVLFPSRLDRRGQRVRSYNAFCDYLLAKAPTPGDFASIALPFEGRSRIIYQVPKQDIFSKYEIPSSLV
jgi:hypothetical protein